MTNYSTNLSDWGASGEAYPSGYSYVEGEAPVDDWDNFLTSNLINDVQHLISLTNTRLDSGTDTQPNRPSDPTMGELFFDQSTSRLQFWDGTVGTWREAATKGEIDYHEGETNNPHSVTLEQARSQDNTVSGTLEFDAGDGVENFVMRNSDGDELRFNTAASGWFSVSVYDSSATYDQSLYNIDPSSGKIDYAVVPAVAGDDLVDKGEYGDGGGINADMVDGLHANELGVSIEEDGTELVGPATAVDFTGFLNVTDDGDGTVTIDPTHNHDSRYLNSSGPVLSNNMAVDNTTQIEFKDYSGNLNNSIYVDTTNAMRFKVGSSDVATLNQSATTLHTYQNNIEGLIEFTTSSGQVSFVNGSYIDGDGNKLSLHTDGGGSGMVEIWDSSQLSQTAAFREGGQIDFSSAQELTLPKHSSDPSNPAVGSMWFRTDLD